MFFRVDINWNIPLMRFSFCVFGAVVAGAAAGEVAPLARGGGGGLDGEKLVGSTRFSFFLVGIDFFRHYVNRHRVVFQLVEI